MHTRTSSIRFERTALFALGALVLATATLAYARPISQSSQAPRPAEYRSIVTAAPVVTTPIVVAVPITPVSVEEIPAVSPHGLGALDWRKDSGLVYATAPSSESLHESFNSLQFKLEADAAVPRLFMASFPDDLDGVREVKLRKTLFFKTVLPLVLQVNEEILGERRRIWQLKADLRLGRKLPAVERLWLAGMAKRYGVRRGDMDALMKKVDIIPPSLAIAQAATESGWGTSRFVREGNAMFGEWTWDSAKAGILPSNRDEGKTHRIRAFDSLLDSVRAYALNLNRHRAYRGLHSNRAQMRDKGQVLSGHVLAGHLKAYSERGQIYIDEIRVIMDSNDLTRFDGARLADEPVI